MAKPSLFLKIEQGPKAGARVHCKPASITTIGRARANTLQISKDPGISQKHICFQWRDDAQHTGWMAMDMGSCNGTIINEQHAASEEWICLQVGDLIKIGAETTIRVEIAGVSDVKLQTAPKVKERSTMRRTCTATESHCKGGAEECGGRFASTESHGKGIAEEDDVRESKHEIKSIDTMHADVDLSMTVEQWFQHMMDEGPKYLYQVSEAMIQDILLESQQFDEYVTSLV